MNLENISDVDVKVTVELGRAKKTIQEILSMGDGSIVQLDKIAGEPLNVLVNGKLFAKGEVVVIDDNFGLRVTEILNQKIDKAGK